MTILVTIRYTCGCGFQATNQDAAIEHCSKQKHSMDIIGTVKKG